MNRPTLAWASFVLLIAVAFGAFGAHGLKAKVTPEALGQWHTGVQYQFYHGFGLLFLALAAEHLPSKTIMIARGLFLGGILFFCGSLYLLATRAILDTDGMTFILGPITPLGGLLFIAGWGVLAVAGIRAYRA